MSTPRVMGILNVTPDSFSDGGVHFDRTRAVEAALQMEADGAAIIDIGGESTRPGSEGVSAEVELDRVLPVIEELRKRSSVTISIDTMKAAVAEAALKAGANVINDVGALARDPGMRPLAARTGVPVILMHMRGEPRTMQHNPVYDDVVTDTIHELAQWRDAAIAAGVKPENILIDPGIGFGKTFDHNLQILARCEEYTRLAPLVIGASRKAFIGHLTGQPGGAARMHGSLAAVAAAFEGGAQIIRVHDVRPTVDFLNVLTAIAQHHGQRTTDNGQRKAAGGAA